MALAHGRGGVMKCLPAVLLAGFFFYSLLVPVACAVVR